VDTECSLPLPDGRRLAFAEFGAGDGVPVMYFHGAPSSRFEPLLIGDETWRRLGLRVIAADRPGMGGSDFQEGRGFSDWPGDVAALADALDWKRFAILGNSGGGGYAAACAALIPQRITKAVIISGGWRMDSPECAVLPLPNRLLFKITRHAPWLAGLMLKTMAATTGRDPAKELAQMKPRVPPPDFAAFSVPGRMAALSRMIRESVRSGPRGATWDLGLYLRPFDFEVSAVRAPLVMFHGTEDANMPVTLARRMSRELPNARLIEFPGEAHLSTLTSHIDEIAAALRG
jgi:pimeloyl-ACP methyl ester carboxylesterase